MDTETLVRVVARREVADRVVEFTLGPVDVDTLPGWAPGAHIDVVLDEEVVRQYSLCGDPADPGHWRIAVLHEPGGRGGSVRAHDELQVGVTVLTRGPRNHFGLKLAPRLLFIAGGIGITPLLPMIAAVEAQGIDWELWFGGRTRDSMAYLDETAGQHPDRVKVFSQADDGLIDLESALGTARLDTLVYCCGPEPLLSAVEARCARWPAGALRVERFAPAVPLTTREDVGFDVEFVTSGVRCVVEPGRSIVEVAEDHGIGIITSCEEGVCGTCETKVLAGEPDHRDSVLTDSERAAGDTMMICVSRCRGALLRLDL